MIKANELRIGNKFRTVDDKTELTVCGITPHDEKEPACIWYGNEGGFYLEAKECEPIPLTEEWLVKLGFEKYNDYDFKKEHYRLVIRVGCEYEGDGSVSVGESNEDVFLRYAQCNYVHQLQNLYFALTGEQLTAK